MRSVVFAAGCILLCGCHKAPLTGAEAPPAAESSAAKADGVTLTPDQIDKLGIVTQPARSIDYSDEAAGYGVVVSHDIVAQAAAELATAQATAQLSRSALSRAQRLAGTAGAVSADVQEAAAQKAAVDAAALTLTTQRLSSTLGMSPPWNRGGRGEIPRDLAGGRIKLVRATFPLGALSGGIPASLRATRIGAGKPGAGWAMTVIWEAPADSSVPGRSLFALLKGSDAAEGDRLQVWAPIGLPVAGVMIPSDAAVLSDGKFWCYIETKPGLFTRTEIETSKPVSNGYFVSHGIMVGDKIVTAAAGQLLAKETGSAAESD
jgi:hypothetical protein